MTGDCRELMAGLADGSVDAIVTDPPYELGFMGKSWDASGIAYDLEVWRQALRVLKPGGHLLAFSGSRTYHRMVCAIEDAGFEIRDQIMWLYGSGFPKSHDVSKAIDREAGAERRVVGSWKPTGTARPSKGGGGHSAGRTTADGGYTPDEEARISITAPATPEAEQWSGWGTALKPAHEPIVVARKPFKGTVAQNVMAHGTGALNVDGCRVGTEEGDYSHGVSVIKAHDRFYGKAFAASDRKMTSPHQLGRWPANVIHDGSDEITSGLGEAARFFYCAKASKRDREEGLRDAGIGALRDAGRPSEPRANHHPTVKPTDLMRYLCRLVTPPGGLVLDPFTGSGSTGKAAVLEGFRFLGCELSEEYAAIARARIAAAQGPGARSQGPDTP
jgi:site-specific DNA-methyltransferase (adenine-specific)